MVSCTVHRVREASDSEVLRSTITNAVGQNGQDTKFRKEVVERSESLVNSCGAHHSDYARCFVRMLILRPDAAGFLPRPGAASK